MSASRRLTTRRRDNCGLLVEFRRRADRYSHSVSLVVKDEVVPLLASTDGDSQQDWPPSPPLQQIDVHRLVEGLESLLSVGMAGTSHWSLAVETERDDPVLVFDVACRVRALPTQLGSTYEIASGVDRLGGGPAWIELELAGRLIRVAMSHSNGTDGLIAHTERTLSIRPLQVQPHVPSTIRWCYRIEVSLSR